MVPLTVLRPVGVVPSGEAAAGIAWIDWTSSPHPSDVEWRHHWRDGDEIVLSLASDGGDYWLRAPGIADFLVQLQPCRILVAPDPSADDSTLEHILVDQVLPRVLAQHGELMVHASALAIGGRNALFTGPSGWGKSTLAGLLQRQGHAMLSDDCVQLVPDGERFNAVPTYPSLRLYADSLDELFPGLGNTAPVASYSEKRRVPLHAVQESDVSYPVDALYMLGDPDVAGDAVSITPLGPAETCQALLRHSFRLDLADRAANAHQFGLCGAVTRAVPAFRLDYPRDFTRSDELVRHLTHHLATLPTLDRHPA